MKSYTYVTGREPEGNLAAVTSVLPQVGGC